MDESENVVTEEVKIAAELSKIQNTEAYKIIREKLKEIYARYSQDMEFYYENEKALPLHIGARFAIRDIEQFIDSHLTIANDPQYERYTAPRD